MSNRRGGLGIRDPVASSSFAFQSSKNGTRRLSEAVFTGAKLDLCEHETQMVLARNEARILQDSIEEAMFIDKTSELSAPENPPKNKGRRVFYLAIHDTDV